MTATSIVLPWPPSVNGAWYRGVKGRLTKSGRMYRDTVIDLVRSRSIAVGFKTSVRVDLYFFPPDRRVRDNSNHTKVLYDVLSKAGFWDDDALIKSETYFSGEVVRGGAVLLYCESFDWVPWKFADTCAAHGADLGHQ